MVFMILTGRVQYCSWWVLRRTDDDDNDNDNDNDDDNDDVGCGHTTRSHHQQSIKSNQIKLEHNT
jgi:hypothetical protein